VDVLVLCACGVWGRPEDVGWMGDCCGPCHDRRAAGEPVAPAVAAWRLENDGGHCGASPDGVLLFRLDEAGTVTVRNMTTGAERTSPPLKLTGVRHGQAYALGPGGRLLARCASDDGVRVGVWDLNTGRQQLDFHAPASSTPEPRCLFASSGELLVLAEEFFAVRAASGGDPLPFRCDFPLPTHWQGCFGFDVSRDGRLAVTLGPPSGLTLWDVPRRLPLRRLTGIEPARGHVTFSPDGATLALVAQYNAAFVSIRDAATLEQVRELRLPTQDRGMWWWGLRSTPDGRCLLFCVGEGVLVLDAVTGEERQRLIRSEPSALEAGQLLPDGRLRMLARVDGGTELRLWPVEALTAPRPAAPARE
jgi:WD40 repeat protein